jgi:hypothetical protein
MGRFMFARLNFVYSIQRVSWQAPELPPDRTADKGTPQRTVHSHGQDPWSINLVEAVYTLSDSPCIRFVG